MIIISSLWISFSDLRALFNDQIPSRSIKPLHNKKKCIVIFELGHMCRKLNNWSLYNENLEAHWDIWLQLQSHTNPAYWTIHYF